MDAESDEASGDDDNADFMKVNDEQPTEEFCKAITPTISAYKKFESLYSVIRGLVAVNDAPAPAGEERVGKWSASMKVWGDAARLGITRVCPLTLKHCTAEDGIKYEA